MTQLTILASSLCLPKFIHFQTVIYRKSRNVVIDQIGSSSLLCKVEFNQSFCWLYFVPNLLVIQHLEILYLGGNHVKVVCEKV